MDVKTIEILLVEDSLSDIGLTREAFDESKVPNNLNVVRDGIEALAFLYRQHQYAEAPRPDLILLDLNLPRKNGRELLSDIKADKSLRRIPVVVLTSSKAEEDVLETYNLYANCYISKPINFDQFIQVVQYIEGFWLSIVTLPRE